MQKIMILLFLGAVSLFSGGCATMMSRPVPVMADGLQFGITDKHAPEEDWAPGAFSLGKSNICFAKTQGEKDADGAQALFGLIGRAIAVGDMAGEIKHKIGDQQDLFNLDLTSVARDRLEKELKNSDEGSRFDPKADWKKAPLQITPYAVFSFIDEDKARFWLVLRSEWIEKGKTYTTKKWNCRYLVGLGEPRPLTGEGGWTSQKGELLRSTLKDDMKIAMKVMLEDLQGKLRVGNELKSGMWANWMFYKKPHYADVQELKTEKDWDVVLPLVEDEEFFAGINIVPKGFALPAPPPRHGLWGGMEK